MSGLLLEEKVTKDRASGRDIQMWVAWPRTLQTALPRGGVEQLPRRRHHARQTQAAGERLHGIATGRAYGAGWVS